MNEKKGIRRNQLVDVEKKIKIILSKNILAFKSRFRNFFNKTGLLFFQNCIAEGMSKSDCTGRFLLSTWSVVDLFLS